MLQWKKGHPCEKPSRSNNLHSTNREEGVAKCISMHCDTLFVLHTRYGGCPYAKEGLVGPLSYYPPRPTGPGHSKCFLFMHFATRPCLLRPPTAPNGRKKIKHLRKQIGNKGYDIGKIRAKQQDCDHSQNIRHHWLAQLADRLFGNTAADIENGANRGS